MRGYGRTPHIPTTPDSRLLKWGAAVAILLGLGITALNVIHVNAYMLLLGPVLVLAGILAVRTQRNGTDPAEGISAPLSKPTSLLLQAVFWLLLAWAALMAHGAATERPLAFFIVVAVAWALLALRTMEKPKPATIASILFGAIVLSLVVRGSVFFLTPGFPGSDAWAHDQLAQAILGTGHIPAEWESPYYLHYPALHLTVAATALITATTTKTALFAGVGMPLALSALAIFVLARHFIGSRLALLATLLALSSSYHLQWGTQIIPTSLGLTLFTLGLTLCLKSDRPQKAEILLLLLTATAVVLSHTVSSFILWMALLVLMATSVLLRTAFRNGVFPYAIRSMVLMALFLTITMFLHWSMNPYLYSGESFLEWMLATARESIRTDAGFLERPWDNAAGRNLVQELAAVSSFGLFYLLVTLGSLCALRGNRPHSGPIIIAVVVALLSIFVFAFPLFGIRTILPHRWFAFIWVPATVLAAIGLCSLSGAYASAGIVKPKAVLVGITGLLTFLMVTAPVSNTESPLNTFSLTQRLCFYESELCAAQWLTNTHDGPVAADQQFGIRVLRDTMGLTHIYTDAHNPDSDTHYVWRHTSLMHPIQDGGEIATVPGASHAIMLEQTHCAVHTSTSSTVFAPVGASRNGRAADGS